MLSDFPIPRDSTVRYSPSPRVFVDRPGDTQCYFCPVCGASLPKFQLRKDYNGVPRMVDMTGMPCSACRESV